MGEIQQPSPVLLLLAAFSRHEALFAQTAAQAAEQWGPIALRSEAFRFEETGYYEPTMGPGLQKIFFAFEQLIDPGWLPEIKRQTNRWEAACSARGEHDEARPLNLDPGYIHHGKLVLASTKDHAHRIYLAGGIYAEVTLFFQRAGGWRHHEWTFPDYRREDYQAFFTECREYYRRRLREDSAA